MGTVRADNFSDGAGTGAPDFADGAKFSGGFDTTGDAGVSSITEHGLVQISDGTTAGTTKVGEILSTDEAADTNFTTNVAATIAEVILTAGTWLVHGSFHGQFTAAATAMANHQISISTTDNTHDGSAAGRLFGKVQFLGAYADSGADGGSLSQPRILDLPAGGTAYLVVTASFTSGAAKSVDSNIWALRIR